MTTDGSRICGLCGEWLTGCMLCETAPLIRPPAETRQPLSDEMEARMQERSIRDAAERRWLEMEG